MSALRPLRRRWIAVFLSVIFAFCLSEAMVPEVCDGDFAGAATVSSADERASVPDDRAPGHGGAHVCHCAHTNGVLSTTAPSLAGAVESCAPAAWSRSPMPPERTLQPDLRPPIA